MLDIFNFKIILLKKNQISKYYSFDLVILYLFFLFNHKILHYFDIALIHYIVFVSLKFLLGYFLKF